MAHQPQAGDSLTEREALGVSLAERIALDPHTVTDSDRYEVSTTPTLVLVRGGDEVHRIAGATTPSSISEAMQNFGGPAKGG